MTIRLEVMEGALGQKVSSAGFIAKPEAQAIPSIRWTPSSCPVCFPGPMDDDGISCIEFQQRLPQVRLRFLTPWTSTSES